MQKLTVKTRKPIPVLIRLKSLLNYVQVTSQTLPVSPSQNDEKLEQESQPSTDDWFAILPSSEELTRKSSE